MLLEEVLALEDEIVNRTMADFDKVVSDATREYWREQLVSNRAGAMAALEELAEAKRGAGDGATRRPIRRSRSSRMHTDRLSHAPSPPLCRRRSRRRSHLRLALRLSARQVRLL